MKTVSQAPTISLKIIEKKKEIYATFSQKQAFSNYLLRSGLTSSNANNTFLEHEPMITVSLNNRIEKYLEK